MAVLFLRRTIYLGPPNGHLATCFDVLDVVMQVARDQDGAPVQYVTHVDVYARWLDLCAQQGVTFPSYQAIEDLFHLCFASVVGMGYDPDLAAWAYLACTLPDDSETRTICVYEERDGTLHWGWWDEMTADMTRLVKPQTLRQEVRDSRDRQAQQRRASLQVIDGGR